MDDWKNIWDEKGRAKTLDVKELDGFEDTDIDFKYVADKIIESLKIKDGDSILEVGCGAGGLAQHLQQFTYYGVDRSLPMLKKYTDVMLKYNVCQSEANRLLIPDKHYDYVIMYSVAQYFPDYVYFENVINEIERCAKKAIFIGDIVETSKRESHLIFNRKATEFKYWNMSDGYYTADRFNIWRGV